MVPRRRFLLGLILVLGAALRLALYLSRPSLSIDETSYALDIGTQTFVHLLAPLESLQTAAPLFHWGIKLLTQLAGMNEYALRAVPLAAGLLVPYMMWRVGCRVVGEPAALFAATLAALAPTLVQYSVIVKPYITDAAISLALIDCSLSVLEQPHVSRAWWRLAGAGILAVLGSVPAPLLLSGVAAAVFLGAPAARWRLAACLVVWVAAFLPLYAALYRPVAASEYMQEFWGASFFAPAHWRGWQLLGRVVVQSLVARPAPLPLVLAVIALVAAGFWMVARARGRGIAALLGIPVLMVLVASALQRYPLSARLLVGITPAILLCCAAAVTAVAQWRATLGRGLGVVILLALAAVNVTHPYRTPALRLAVLETARAAIDGPVYVSAGAIPAWAFYTTDWSAPDTGYLRRIRRWAGRPNAIAFPNAAPRGRPVGPMEGSELVEQRQGRMEILGLAPGIQWREAKGLSGTVPDSGWAAREAARIHAAATPVAWVLLGNAYATSGAALVAALQDAGGRLEVDAAAGGVRRCRVRFGPAN